jgi:hypothetical protein
LGYSPWSGWCKPVAPQAGVWLKSYNAQELSMLIEWFIPIINSSSREIQCYELQICNIQGQYVISHPPLSSSSSSSVASKKKMFNINRTEINDHSKPSQEINEFITLSNSITDNCYLVRHLKAGRKYQFRVRAKIRDVPEEEEDGDEDRDRQERKEIKSGRGVNSEDEDGWPSWETLSVISEMIQMSSTIPDAPKLLRPAFVLQSNYNRQHRGVERDGNEEKAGKKELFAYNPVNIAYDQIVEDEKKYINYGHTIGQPSAASDEEEKIPECADNKQERKEEMMSTIVDNNSESLLHPYPSEISIANSLSSEYQLPKTKIDLTDSFDISHNSITITFTNGDSNGEVIEAYEIQLTKIRNYHFQDILHAKEAFLGIAEDDEDEDFDEEPEKEGNGIQNEKKQNDQKKGRNQRYEERMNHNLQTTFFLNNDLKSEEDNTYTSSSPAKGSSKNIHSSYFAASSGLQWITVFNNENEPHLEDKILSQITSYSSSAAVIVPSYHSVYRVEIVGKQSYRINNLLPGSVYIFRIRAKNKLGWSPYSHSSPLISTFPSIPPEKPLIIVKQQSFVILCWKEMIERLSSSPAKPPSALKTVTESESNSDKANALFPTASEQEELLIENNTSNYGLTTLEYQIQIRKVSFNRLHTGNYLSNENDGNNILLEYLGDWNIVNSQVLTHKQITQQLLTSTSTAGLISFLPSHIELDTVITNGKKSNVVGGNSESVKYIVLSNLIEFNWYIIRIRIRTILGWSPWSESSDPFRMEK